jgi:hypothetical protein
MLDYQELKIRISRDAAGGYRTFAEGPSGNASGSFVPPYSTDELDEILREISGQVGRARRRRVEAPDTARVKHFGGVLFDALFQDDVRDLYSGSLRAAEDENEGLRVTLALKDAPELMLVPWEFLYDEPNFLAISELTPIVRYLDLRKSREPIAIDPPLRILAMVSSPIGVVELDVDREIQNIDRALARLKAEGAVEITWLDNATLDELQSCLLGGPYHVFHYIGHGEYDDEQEDGVLLLEDDRGRADPVSGVNLGATLAPHRTLRLATLNSCEGGRTADDDPFAGVATSLVQSQIPAVIAMQFEITDRMASVFSEWLYKSLAGGLPVDSALSQARLAMFNRRSGVEWGTPVLFMRVQDGRIFGDPHPPPVPPPPPPPLPVPWWRRRIAALVAAAVLVLLAVAAAAAYGLRSSDDGVPPQSDLWSAEASIPSMQRMLDVAANGPEGAFAVGAKGGQPVAQRYASGDWSEETVQSGSGVMRTLAVSGGTAIAGGRIVNVNYDAGIWRRSGGSWVLACFQAVCGDGAPGAMAGAQQILDLTVSGGFVAVGRETGNGIRRPAVWRSDDGTDWTRLADDDLSNSGDYMIGVVAKGKTVVAVGNSGQDGAAWISKDAGRHWTKVTDDDLAARGRSVEPQAVSLGPSGFVAVGKERLEKDKPASPVAWFSDDGSSWTRASIQRAQFSGQEMVDVAWTGTGLFAVGIDRKNKRAAVWQSVDGKDWSPVSSSSFSGTGQPSMSSVDLVDGTVTAVGTEGGQGQVWSQRPS